MENINKALLIAVGVLFAILVLTLLVIFHNQISSYYTEQHDSKMVEQITEFNNKFENYNGQTIRGNELISVMNRVVDYNRTYSDMEGADRVTITIDLQGYQKELLYTGTPSSDILFPKSIISNSSGNDNEISRISELSTELANSTGIEDTKLQKMSAEISTICDTSTDDDSIKKIKEKLRKILGYKQDKEFSQTQIIRYQSATRKYYQLTQFKRVMFKCTEVVHNQKDGRINKISFEAVIENNALKLN